MQPYDNIGNLIKLLDKVLDGAVTLDGVSGTEIEMLYYAINLLKVIAHAKASGKDEQWLRDKYNRDRRTYLVDVHSKLFATTHKTPQEELYGETKLVGEAFLKHILEGKALYKDIVKLIDRAGGVQETLTGIEWIFSDDADGYVKNVRTKIYSLAYLNHIWHYYELSKPTEEQEFSNNLAMLALEREIAQAM